MKDIYISRKTHPGVPITGLPFDIRHGAAVTLGFRELHVASKKVPVLVTFATFTYLYRELFSKTRWARHCIFFTVSTIESKSFPGRA